MNNHEAEDYEHKLYGKTKANIEKKIIYALSLYRLGH